MKKIKVDLTNEAFSNLPVGKMLFLCGLAKKKQKYCWRAKLSFLWKDIVNKLEDEILNLTDGQLLSAS